MAKLTPSTIRIGKRYRANRLQQKYDVIIIGSGISGLTAARLLSSVGKKVLVLEQHYTAGGFTHSYERKGFEWDVGVHYIGEMYKGALPRKIMDFVTNYQLDWAEMDEEFDRFYIKDKVYSVIKGKENYRNYLYQQFPQEKRAIDQYFKLIEQSYRSVYTLAFGRVSMHLPVLKFLLPVFNKVLPKTMHQSTYDVLSSLTKNQELIAALTGQWLDHALPPKQSGFFIHAITKAHYMNGAFYPIGGSWKIADYTVPKLKEDGSDVFTYANVKQILVKNKKAYGVLMEDGHEIYSDCIISSAGVHNTFEKLLSREVVQQTSYSKKMRQVKPSISYYNLFVGLKGTPEELKLPKRNNWILPSNDSDADFERYQADQTQPYPVIFVGFASAKDPTFTQRHPNKSTLEILAFANYEDYQKWEDTTWGKRGEDYEALKDEHAKRLLEEAFKIMPHLTDKVEYYEMGTPLTPKYFNGYQYGETYGLNHDTQRFGQNWLAPKTEIDGLWLTGQDILSCGLVTSMASGLQTAMAIAGVKLLPLLGRVLLKSSE